MKSIWKKVSHSVFLFFFNWLVSLNIEQPRNFFLLSSKQLLMSLLFLSHVLHSTLTDWLANFERWASLICLLKFDIAFSEILVTAYADQLLYNLNLIKLCLVCPKQVTTVKMVSDACSILQFRFYLI